MGPNNMTRVLIDAAVRKVITTMQTDVKRGTNDLITLGLKHFRSPLLLSAFTAIGRDLKREHSSYEAAFKELVSSASALHLRRFFINLGYHALSYGEKIRTGYRKKNQLRPPWYLTFRFSKEDPFSAGVLSERICEANQMGIYCFVFFFDAYPPSGFFHLLADNPDSVFFCFLPEIRPDFFDMTAEHVLYLFPEAIYREQRPFLFRQQILCGMYHTGEVSTLPPSCEAPILMLCPANPADPDERAAMHNLITKARTAPPMPYFFFQPENDLYEAEKLFDPSSPCMELLGCSRIYLNGKIFRFKTQPSLLQILTFARTRQK